MTQQLTDLDKISEGYVILVSGLLIVFSALLILSVFFKFGMPALFSVYNAVTKPKKKSVNVKEKPPVKLKNKEEISGEVMAAISTALHLYLHEQHDDENAVLTIKQAKKLYSPWSSKIYGIQNRL